MKEYLLLFKRLSLLLLLYLIGRICFLIFNFNEYTATSFADIVKSFFYGLQFDISIILLTNSLFILLSILPHSFVNTRPYQLVLKVIYLVINIPLIIINLIDAEYFKFTGKRMTYDIMGMQSDISDQIWQLLVYYWYITLIAITCITFLWIFYPKLSKPIQYRKTTLKYLLLPLLTATVVIIIRGGIQLKPLRPANAFEVQPTYLGHLILNTPFTFINTINIPRVERVNYFTNNKEIYDIIHKPTQSHFANQHRHNNVVIIILESFAMEYIGSQGFSPFLDSLAGQSLFFKNNYANGRTSMNALPSILASIPALMEEPFIMSTYQTNEINGLGSILKKEGYHSSFFHGGKNGTMGFDAFAHYAGFEHYYGLNEYPSIEKDYNGSWGIHDEPYLQYFCNKLSSFPQPFVSGVFTLSSHQPYIIPKEYKGKFPKGDIEILESIAYTDYSLKAFFKQAAIQPWFSNTLFIITADHTQMHFRDSYRNMLGDYNVPLLFYNPKEKITADTSKITQHTDILPSVMDYLNIRQDKKLFFGESVFNDSEGTALSFSDNTYRIIHKNYFLELNNNGQTKLFDKKTLEPIVNDSISDIYSKELKAYIQYFNNGIIDNIWYKFKP